jgi:hypothetical protein
MNDFAGALYTAASLGGRGERKSIVIGSNTAAMLANKVLALADATVMRSQFDQTADDATEIKDIFTGLFKVRGRPVLWT